MTALIFLSSSGLGGRELNTIRLIPYLWEQGAKITVAVLDSGGYVTDQCAVVGVDFKCLGLWPSKLNVLIVLWRCFFLLLSKRPDVIQVYGYQASMICRLAALPLRIKVVVGIVGTGHFSGFRPLTERLTSRLVSHYTTNSLGAKDRLYQILGCRVPGITVIYNGVPDFKVARVESSDRVFTSGTVGNLRPEKGYDILLEAIVLTKVKLGDGFKWKHLVAGDGVLRDRLTVRINELGLTGQVVLLGKVDDVVGVLGQLDLFILASHTEGLPNAVLEAMMAGRCVIASSVGGIPEIITDGETGLLVEPGDPEDLSRALQSVICKPKWRDSMAIRGRALVQTRFTLKRQAEDTIKAWRLIS